MKNQKKIVFLVIFLVSIFKLSGLSFQDINLSSDDRLIFRVDFENQHALFVSDLNNMSLRQLTAFPEKMYLVENGRSIIALNHFGAVRIPAAGGLPNPLPGYPSFTAEDLPMRGRLQDLSPSPDGRWILYVEPVSFGYGDLILVDITNGERRTVTQRIEIPGLTFPVKWSPDSRYFVYSKSGSIYYYPINNNIFALVDERFREIGRGTIDSVLWGQQGDFYYLTENILYRVINPELFTRTMYGDFLSIGNVVSVLPVNFDSGFDRFWIAPDSGSILINKAGKGFFIFLLGRSQDVMSVQPHVMLPFGAEDFNVLWSSSGELTVTYTFEDQTMALRFKIDGSSIRHVDLYSSPAPFTAAALSPDETNVLFWGENGLELWNYNEWQRIQILSSQPVYACIWTNNRQFIMGNSRFIEEITIAAPSYPSRVICLSGADSLAYEENSSPSQIVARSGITWYATNGTDAWTTVNNVQLRQITFASDNYRVFLEPLSGGYYSNIIMIRNLRTTTTFQFLADHRTNSIYSTGRQRQIALCFDLYDDDTGLPQVLAALSRFNIRATFFLNGDFIRRNPQAAAAIVRAGHETASLFYAPIDISDTRYRITQDFIIQGLARNEDEFFQATGSELSVLWHPPLYRSSALASTAAAAAGYITVARSIDPGDWLSREDALRLNIRQTPPAEIVEQILGRSESGAVVPVRLGLLPGGRDEYLYQRIEVLLDALIRSGCEVVPVSSVVRR